MNGITTGITVSPPKIMKLLVVIVVAVGALNFLALYSNFVLGYDWVFGMVPMFIMDFESNLPTYFSSTLLLFSSYLLFVIASVMRDVSNKYAHHWMFLALIFLFMSIDEVAGFHELLADPLKDGFNLSGFLTNSWVIIGFIVVTVIAIIYWNFFMALPRETKIGIALAAFFFLAGVLGIEMLSAGYYDLVNEENYTYLLITSVEELLEMVGLLIFIATLLKILVTQQISFIIAFKNDQESSRIT